MIKQNDPLANYLHLKPRIDGAVTRVLSSGHYILGQETEAFEREFAEYLGGGYCVGVANGTEALFLALKACGVGPGNEVITVSHTAVATVASIQMCGATPVMVDIDAKTYTIDCGQVSRALTSRTKAIVPVHLYGQPADMEPLITLAERHGVYLIEDCAQAHGATYQGRKAGTFGHAAAFSFYPTKNMGCLGDGGAVVTRDRILYDRLLGLRQYGWDENRISITQGFNSRLDELQAAILRVKLKYLDKSNERRARLAQAYNGLLDGLPLDLPREVLGVTHVYHQYVIGCQEEPIRDELLSFLYENQVQCAIHYPVPVHLQRGYARTPPVSLPVTEQTARRIVSLPMYPELKMEQVEEVSNRIYDFFHRSAR
ncbi:MAG: DegT/DnrJ/EryC1/StrS family aminotransferase [Deltaproteobacteria bacterium]|nr:DegT/DnrJ/EryC1/StrS family aminotransferase [Deltaproteobacteria bacterium]MBW2138624.1 DegT/DnrJ/EryC1/StrS family aminotransferase [Deltaproteobacteria bacterium]